MVQLAATFLTPISIILVQNSVSSRRCGRLFLCFLSQAFKCTLLFWKAKETAQGKKRIAETKKHSALPDVFRLWKGF